jgi:hypothetical protein
VGHQYSQDYIGLSVLSDLGVVQSIFLWTRCRESTLLSICPMYDLFACRIGRRAPLMKCITKTVLFCHKSTIQFLQCLDSQAAVAVGCRVVPSCGVGSRRTVRRENIGWKRSGDTDNGDVTYPMYHVARRVASRPRPHRVPTIKVPLRANPDL